MRRTIRLALPAVAVATALVLAGCKSGRGGGSSSGDHGGGSSGTGGQHDDDDDDDDLDIDFGGTTGGGGTTSGGGSGGRTDTDPAPTVAQLEGDWYTGVDPMAANLQIEAGQVTFYEDFDVEGDVCDGTVADGRLTLTSCQQFGTETWDDETATLALAGDVLRVTWASGTTMEMRDTHTPGSFTEAELAELQATIDRLNSM